MSSNSDPSSTDRQCPKRLGAVVAIAFGLHMLAVLAEPMRFFCQSEFQVAPETDALRRWAAPYAEWLYLDHGYFFFAPNPGPSHLVAAELARSNPVAVGPQTPTMTLASPKPSVANTEPESVDLGQFEYVFPDRKRQWPRLLYHRYFMLSEFYNNSFAPQRLLPEEREDAGLVERWNRDRNFYVQLGHSISKSLEQSLQCEPLRLRRIERDLLTPATVLQEGWKLDDPRGLLILPEGPPEDESKEVIQR